MNECRLTNSGGPDAEALQAFVRLFDAGEFFASHEVLEARWLITRDPFQRGLIILAAAFVHRDRGNLRGLTRQLAKARRYLVAYLPCHQNLDVRGLLAGLDDCLAGLEQASSGALESLVEAPRLRSLLRTFSR